MAGVCPRCTAAQSRNSPLGSFSFAFLPGPRLPSLREAIARVINRRWGRYRRLLDGALFEAGEHEVGRVHIKSFSIYAVDGHTIVGHDAACMLTNRRIVISDPSGHMAETRLAVVRSVQDHREYDPHTGFSYGVAVSCVGSPVHDPKGDVYMYCTGQSDSGRLLDLFVHATQSTRAATVA